MIQLYNFFQCCLPEKKGDFPFSSKPLLQRSFYEQADYKVREEIFDVPTLKGFSLNTKIAQFFSKMTFIPPAEFLISEGKKTNGPTLEQIEIDTLASKLRHRTDLLTRRFLMLQPHCADERLLPAIQYSALVLLGRVILDMPYNIGNYSFLFQSLKNKVMPTKITCLTREELAEEAENLFVTQKKLVKMELEFLKGVNWNLNLTED